MKKRFIISLLCLSIITGNLLFQSTASAAGDPGPDQVIFTPMLTNIISFNNNFSIYSDGEARLDSSLSFRDADEGMVVVYLQKNISGSWVNIKSWSNTINNYVTVSGSYYVSSGAQYRMCSYGYVFVGGSIIETISYVSPVKSY